MKRANSLIVMLTLLGGILAATTARSRAEDPEEKDPNFIEQVTMHVKPHLADCTGVAPRKCMVVRVGDSEKWTFFYSSIAGFTYEEGFWYELKVDKFKVPNVPADASSIRYKLVEVVSKKKDE